MRLTNTPKHIVWETIEKKGAGVLKVDFLRTTLSKARYFGKESPQSIGLSFDLVLVKKPEIDILFHKQFLIDLFLFPVGLEEPSHLVIAYLLTLCTRYKDP